MVNALCWMSVVDSLALFHQMALKQTQTLQRGMLHTTIMHQAPLPTTLHAKGLPWGTATAPRMESTSVVRAAELRSVYNLAQTAKS